MSLQDVSGMPLLLKDCQTTDMPPQLVSFSEDVTSLNVEVLIGPGGLVVPREELLTVAEAGPPNLCWPQWDNDDPSKYLVLH